MLEIALQELSYEVAEDVLRFNVCLETGNQEVDRIFVVSLTGVDDTAIGWFIARK